MEAPSLRSERRARVMLAATLLFAGIFAARVLDRSASSGTTILYVLPIVLVGVELGYRAGLAAGLVALGLFAVWAPFAPIHVAWSAYVTRGVVFVLVGAVAGRLADRLDRALRSADAGARHFELARDLLCTATLDGHLTHLNGSWEECLGWTREELMAKPFVAFVHPGDRDRTAARLAAGELTVNFRNRFQHKDGSWRWIEWSSRADPERGLLHAAARDVTAARQLEQARDDALEQLRFLADHDPLSGVYNRRRFAQELRRELAAAGHATRCSVVLLIDVDEFKAINDALGHAMGDAVIGCLGAALSRRLRTGDVVARLGGDEFAVLLRRINVETAMRMAHDLQALVSARIAELLGDAHPPVTLSLGLAAVGGPDAARTVDDLLGRADRALYAAKRAGKNRVIATPVAAAGVAGPDAAVG